MVVAVQPQHLVATLLERFLLHVDRWSVVGADLAVADTAVPGPGVLRVGVQLETAGTRLEVGTNWGEDRVEEGRIRRGDSEGWLLGKRVGLLEVHRGVDF